MGVKLNAGALNASGAGTKDAGELSSSAESGTSDATDKLGSVISNSALEQGPASPQLNTELHLRIQLESLARPSTLTSAMVALRKARQTPDR